MFRQNTVFLGFMIIFLYFISFATAFFWSPIVYLPCKDITKLDRANYMRCQIGTKFIKENNIDGRILIWYSYNENNKDLIEIPRSHISKNQDIYYKSMFKLVKRASSFKEHEFILDLY